MDIDKIKQQVDYLLDLSFELETEFDLKKARHIYKEFKKLNDLVYLLIKRLTTTKQFTDIDLKNYEDYLNNLQKFLSHITRYNIKTNSGFNMFIKDVVSYNFNNSI